MVNFATPTDWKSEVWWRKRSSVEREFHCHFPPRIINEALDDRWPMANPKLYEKNVLIHGASASGKSVTAAKLLAATIQTEELSGRWIEADDYIEMLKDSFNNDGVLPEMYSSPHLIKYLKNVFDIVVLDGLGEERLTEFATHELGSLIRKRFDRNKATIITSRLTISDIKNRYGTRLASVLSDFEIVRT